MMPRPPKSTLFPYTTLFRSSAEQILGQVLEAVAAPRGGLDRGDVRLQPDPHLDRKSTRLNSSHANISYAVFCLKKKEVSASASTRRNAHTLPPPHIAPHRRR